MAGWAIVAIPSADDPVWKFSSEKVPHLTLLYLGDQEGNTSEVDIAGFVQHVADTTLRTRFGLSVDHRGTLGPEDADVLFFEENSTVKKLKAARSNLLTKDAISRAYASTEQYPEWTPHLTMGYPTSPAKPDDREYPGIHWVNFDRIALWTGDSEGYEFRLDNNMSLEDDVAMSDRKYDDDFLAHYGVKGMRWGRRKAEGTSALSTSEDHRRAQTLKKKSLSELSNNELKDLTNRQNLEQQYQRLNPKVTKKGSTAVKAIIGTAGTAVAVYNMVNSPAGKKATEVGAKFVKRSMSEVYKYRAAVGITKAITRG